MVETEFIKFQNCNHLAQFESAQDVTIMTSFHSQVLLGSQKMRTHVTIVFAWSKLTVLFLSCLWFYCDFYSCSVEINR